MLLKAFEILGPERPGLRLLVAGRAADADEVLQRVPAELRDRVVLLGQVSEEDKVRLLHSVDVFCSPNTGGESFGIVTAEAMAAGRAHRGQRHRGVPRRSCDGGQAGELFAVGDAGDLARAAGRLLDDAGRRAELSAAALAAVAQYDWSVVARDVLRVYETVILGRTRVAVSATGGRVPVIIDIILIVAGALFVGVYVSWRAGRIDRLHARVDMARAALDATLLRRSSVALELADLGAARPGHQPAAGRRGARHAQRATAPGTWPRAT